MLKKKTMRQQYRFIGLEPSTRHDKKLMAIFENRRTGREKVVHFGARGMSDYTQHKDRERLMHYLQRHRHSENWNNPLTAGSLSRWILWNKPSLRASLADYRNRFWR